MIIDFIRNLLSKHGKGSVNPKFDAYTTYLTPWYFKGSVPYIDDGLFWRELKNLNGEKLVLMSLNSKLGCLGIIDMYCYLKPLANGQFLIWKRGSQQIELYNSSNFKPIDMDKINWSERKTPYLFNAQPIDSIEYYPDLFQTKLKFDFPDSFTQIEEIIQVNDLDGMYDDYQEGMGNTAIIILKPKENQIDIYPQDWFNKATDIDFGYQWITRADRIIGTDKIKIQGIRIGEYVLDETKKGIVK